MRQPILAVYCAHGGINLISDATLEKLDIVNYAFGLVENKDIVFQHPEDLERIRTIRKQHPNLKLILSVGGGGGGAQMTEAVAERGNFLRLVDRMFEEMVKGGFDGIDLDWEFPTTTGHPEERQLHTEMLKLLRERIDAADRKYYLTVAVPDSDWTFKITELDESQKYLDYVNIMTYDMNRHDFTSHHSAPYSADESYNRSAYGAVKRFKEHGIPPEKIIVGGAFYSKVWSGITETENGLNAPVKNAISYGPGITELENNYIDKNGYKRYWDDSAKAPFLYNGDKFITYEDKNSLGCKCDIVVNENIAGIMIWELCGDRTQTLLPFMRNRLNTLASAK